MKVSIIDYGVGNIASVSRAFEEIGADVTIMTEPSQISEASSIVLPGVGNFTTCKSILDSDGWSSEIDHFANVEKKPLLGICLGMQLLASYGYEGAGEGGRTSGLGLIPGEVVPLESLGCSLRTPHVGWNEVEIKQRDSLMEGLASGTDFYFVHKYAFKLEETAHCIASVNYGASFPVVVKKENIYGVQFHPEKSSKAGFRLLRNFLLGERC